ncbi:TNFAIP3-interacting protein 2 [Erpetoichthys calabaricus]|uniref:TNFAIP3-interacting protein 2 n=1 Tax=Erpetoichthys calabaricus TaxID=27687 RepID=UPI0022348734|nr:TNFAIP3-interacting protein 2 [Erpetoichthys calabaricus]
MSAAQSSLGGAEPPPPPPPPDDTDKLRLENEKLQSKVQSYATVATFYHEARRELAAMAHQSRLKDNVIGELKARLARHESTAVHLGAHDEPPLLFGPSQSLLEGLCKEISRLKQQLKDNDRQSEQLVETLKRELQTLQKQVEEKEHEIQKMIRRPQHEKDLQISELQKILLEKDRVQATREVLCHSLTEEKEQLRTQLAATVQVCQQLAHKLEGKNRNYCAPREDDMEPCKKLPSSEMCDSRQLQVAVQRLQDENDALKQKLAYVESLNAKWQKYDLSREEYVKGLCQKLKEVGSQKGFVPAAASGDIMQQEILRLNRLLEEKMKECGRYSRELEDTRKVDRERIQILEQQALVYADDFNSERLDRERAQSQIHDLKEEVVRLQSQLRRQDSRDRSSPCRAHPGGRSPAQLEADTMEPLLGSSPERTGSGRSTARSPTTQELSAASRRSRAEHQALQCPRCLTTYSDERAAEFLKHCTECAEV